MELLTRLVGVVLWVVAALLAIAAIAQTLPAWVELTSADSDGGSELAGRSLAGVLVLGLAYLVFRVGGWFWDY